jgi:hypothetical protein
MTTRRRLWVRQPTLKISGVVGECVREHENVLAHHSLAQHCPHIVRCIFVVGGLAGRRDR